jgi:hypothetical protein
VTPYRQFEQLGGKNCASRFEAKKALKMVVSTITFEVCIDFFPSHQVIFILAGPSGAQINKRKLRAA